MKKKLKKKKCSIPRSERKPILHPKNVERDKGKPYTREELLNCSF